MKSPLSKTKVKKGGKTMKKKSLKKIFGDRLEIKQMGKVLGGAVPEEPPPEDDDTPERYEG
jgi:hypothetical protein